MRPGAIRDRGRRLRIALVNTMPDAAVFDTQHQFVKLIEAGIGDFDVALQLTTLDGLARSDELRREMAEFYAPAVALRASSPDAVIFTGAEPRAAELDAEPYWRELTDLFDWTRGRSFATLASCLAAHALVLHFDGVRRRRRSSKASGLFATELAGSHPLTDGLSAGSVPHSRWNDLDEADLVARGYIVLTRSPDVGVDMFAKDVGHLALFFQGHPEYDGDTLAREYRRDVRRAFAFGGAAPAPPAGYFSPEVEARLRAHVKAALAGGDTLSLPSEARTGPEAVWRRRLGVVIANWLTVIAARKSAARGPTLARARWGG